MREFRLGEVCYLPKATQRSRGTAQCVRQRYPLSPWWYTIPITRYLFFICFIQTFMCSHVPEFGVSAFVSLLINYSWNNDFHALECIYDIHIWMCVYVCVCVYACRAMGSGSQKRGGNPSHTPNIWPCLGEYFFMVMTEVSVLMASSG